MLVVGLTGGIGSGKSAVARRFAALGVEVEDADAVAHAISAPGAPGHRAIVDAFGPRAVRADGTLDRDWLRERAFADAAFRATLEASLHPLIRARLAKAIAAWTGAYGLLVVPLLIERGGLSEHIGRVLVVDCPEGEQVRRVMARSGLSAETVRRIMATQLSREQRRASADDVIDNAGPEDALDAQVRTLEARYRRLAAEAKRRPSGSGAGFLAE
jgi:dephospho-CoA kinase